MTAPATTPVRIFPAVAHSRSPAAARCVPPCRSVAVARIANKVFIKFLSLFRLSTPFHKYDHVCCVDFRFWRGATREHPPQWGCDRGATKPEPKSDATLRAAVLFGPDVVARSLQTAEGYARRSRLVWAKNPSPQTWSYLWNGVLSSLPAARIIPRLV